MWLSNSWLFEVLIRRPCGIRGLAFAHTLRKRFPPSAKHLGESITLIHAIGQTHRTHDIAFALPEHRRPAALNWRIWTNIFIRRGDISTASNSRSAASGPSQSSQRAAASGNREQSRITADACGIFLYALASLIGVQTSSNRRSVGICIKGARLGPVGHIDSLIGYVGVVVRERPKVFAPAKQWRIKGNLTTRRLWLWSALKLMRVAV